MEQYVQDRIMVSPIFHTPYWREENYMRCVGQYLPLTDEGVKMFLMFISDHALSPS